MPDYFNNSDDNRTHSLRADFTVNVRATDIYQLYLKTNDRSTLWIDQGSGFTQLQQPRQMTDTVVTFRGTDILTEVDGDNDGIFETTSTSSGGRLTTGDVLSWRVKEKSSIGTPDVLLAYRKQGENTWRAIPVHDNDAADDLPHFAIWPVATENGLTRYVGMDGIEYPNSYGELVVYESSSTQEGYEFSEKRSVA
jgi:hypothetical protein